MVNIRAKCATLYFTRLEAQRKTKDIPTDHWLDTMKPIIQWVNPPNRKIMTKSIEYLTSYIGHWAYIGPPKPTETVKTYKNRIYETYIY
jgi:hypothetical protein